MQLQWLGTAGFQLTDTDGTVLLIDPYLSRPSSARPQSSFSLAEPPHADAIFVTHGHFDHAMDVPALVHQLGALVYASAPVCRTLAHHGTPPSHLRPLAPHTTVQVGDVQVGALPARHVHFDPALVLRTSARLPSLRLRCLVPLLACWPAGQVLAFQVTTSALSLIHFGSAGWIRGDVQGLSPDVLLIPIQGRSDISQVAARLAALLRPRLVVPHHWDDFYPPISRLVPTAPFAEALSHALPEAQIHVPEIGQPWQIEV
jgi:L-ascorbate metabolism protein UlaG (beta-lactamase superfamily)